MIDFNTYRRHTEYERTGNPLLAWDMILECRKDNKAFPDWVLEYLESVAEELVNLKPPKGKAAAEIRDALGFKGKPFEAYQRFIDHGCDDDFSFKWKVYQWIEAHKDGAKIEDTIRAAGKHFFGEDEKTENHYSNARKYYDEIKKAE